MEEINIISTKKIFLTFDDGPSVPHTEQILDILKDLNVKATFCVCGKNAMRYPEIIKRISGEGHLITNHTLSHSRFFTTTGFLWPEIVITSLIIKSITGKITRFFRPPWGVMGPFLGISLWASNHKMFLWDVDAKDWTCPPARIIAKEIIEKAEPNSIILLHDGKKTEKKIDRSQTVSAVYPIVKSLKDQGYIFETIDKLLASKK